jgi:hypothetical protein
MRLKKEIFLSNFFWWSSDFLVDKNEKNLSEHVNDKACEFKSEDKD